MNTLIQTLREEFFDRLDTIKPGFVARDITFPDVPNKIKVAVGMRRTGKTYLIFQQIYKLLDSGVARDRILYLNFEDDRLLPLTAQKAAAMIDEFYTLFPENHEQLCYIFLDEIQNAENWPSIVRRFYDTKNVQIYLTGSSAKLLSKEIATALRGRSIAIEVWPYSFTEYLRAKNKDLIVKPVGKKSLDKFGQYLMDFLEVGGFPEVVNLDLQNRLRILQDYVSVVIFRDIVERYKITNFSAIEYMIRALLKNSGTLFSVNKFFNDLKSQGISVSKNTVYDYLGYIEDAYLSFSVPLYTESLRKEKTNPRKIYSIDTGLIKAYTDSFSKNFGRMLETLLYLDFRRRGDKIYYYLTEDRYEVDFLVKPLTGDIKLYQVVWDDADVNTMERETRALNAAEKELGVKGEIITYKSYLEVGIR